LSVLQIKKEVGKLLGLKKELGGDEDKSQKFVLKTPKVSTGMVCRFIVVNFDRKEVPFACKTKRFLLYLHSFIYSFIPSLTHSLTNLNSFIHSRH